MASLALFAGYAPLSFSAGAGSTDKLEVIGTPAPDSKFAKVHEGMYSKEIVDLIGNPTDQKSFQTGKASFLSISAATTTARSSTTRAKAS